MRGICTIHFVYVCLHQKRRIHTSNVYTQVAWIETIIFWAFRQTQQESLMTGAFNTFIPQTSPSTHLSIYIWICIHLVVCVCVTFIMQIISHLFYYNLYDEVVNIFGEWGLLVMLGVMMYIYLYAYRYRTIIELRT